MQILTVHAPAFGPIVDGRLDLAPGLTVVAGANESAKSSWQAAIYAGLCGMRRRQGQPRAADREFAERHCPWDAPGWSVRADLVLADGRHIELAHDLAGRVDSRAVDRELGVDVSNTVMTDGAPDGSVFLGLRREAFRATACIDQAALLAVRDAAGDLQELLQRAAASATADVTAAGALQALAEFRREEVGLDRPNAVRPLRRAIVAVQQAQDALDRARAEHAGYLDLVAGAEGARAAADAAESALASSAARLRAVETAGETTGAQVPAETDAQVVALARAEQRAREVADQARAAAQAAGARAPGSRRPATLGFAAAAVLALVAAGAGALGVTVVAAVAGVVAAGAVTAGLVLVRRSGQAATAVAQAWTAVDAAEQAARAAADRRADAVRVWEQASVAREQEARAVAVGSARAEVATARDLAHQAALEAVAAEEVCADRASRLASVAEAEEALVVAHAEHERVVQLAETLELTEGFLAAAQERAHRDIAPVLNATLQEWLPEVTGGRYVEAMVDPRSLRVQVRGVGGRWRDADRLSVGTAEQIYLLLRIALAQHLVAVGETCPMLLDDVTVQADSERTVRILDLLLRLAADRQIVLFAQEDTVVDWARERLDGRRHRLVLLPPVTSV